MSEILYEVDRKDNDGCHLHGSEPMMISVDLTALWRWGKKKLEEETNNDEHTERDI